MTDFIEDKELKKKIKDLLCQFSAYIWDASKDNDTDKCYDYREVFADDILELFTQEKQKLFGDLLEKVSGGGNWRRIISQNLEGLKK